MITSRKPVTVTPLWPSTRPNLAALFGADQEWRDQAACAEVGPDLFDPPAEHERFSRYPARAAQAAIVCAGCPVRAQCHTYALEHDLAGVFGGHWHRSKRTRQGTHRAHLIEPARALPDQAAS